MSSPPRTKRDTPPKLPSKKQQRSQSLTPIQGAIANGQVQDKYCSADGVIQGKLINHFFFFLRMPDYMFFFFTWQQMEVRTQNHLKLVDSYQMKNVIVLMVLYKINQLQVHSYSFL